MHGTDLDGIYNSDGVKLSDNVVGDEGDFDQRRMGRMISKDYRSRGAGGEVDKAEKKETN